MKRSIPVALLGFGIGERASLVAALQLEAPELPTYLHVLDIDDARFVLADGDQPGVAELLDSLGRAGDAIVVAGRPPQRAAAWVPRPVDPAGVRGLLDRLVAARDGPQAGTDESDAPAVTPRRVQADTLAGRPAEDVAAARPASGEPSGPELEAARRAEAAALRQRREAALRPAANRHALLVDDSDVALAFLERRLHRDAITTDRATTSGQALRLLSERVYGIVFLDLDLGEASELDGLALCQAIKRRQADPAGAAPVVVLVSAFHEPSDRVRGRLAGADGYLGKPIDEVELDRLLRSYGLHPAGGQRAERRTRAP